MLRSATCGGLSAKDIGKKAELCGWVGSRRDHGGLIFIDLRDGYGMTQIVFNPAKKASLHKAAEDLRSEDVIRVEGEVTKRPDGTENLKIATGMVELIVEKLEILNRSLTPPFEISDAVSISEEARLKYRYLDLRRTAMQRNLRLRHRVCKIARDYFDERGFVEVETPILTKSTPEGARDYLVPSRVNPGMFYALPQSPQLFKQILMVASLDRYFQIAKCFRDEDLRADRQPEFTQFDIEMSFVTEEDIFELSEGLMKRFFKEILNLELKTPFPRLRYDEAMRRFGCDKPDTRFGMELVDVSDLMKGSSAKIFLEAIAKGAKALALNAKGCGSYSRSQVDELVEFVKEYGAKGLANFKAEGGSLSSPMEKFFAKDLLNRLKGALAAEDGDMIFILADDAKIACESMSALRKTLGKRLGLIDEKRFDFLWVTDFPLFKFNDEDKRWESEHHPFTSVHPDDMPLLDKEELLGRVRSCSYDFVVNGVELGSGSIRIHERKLQEKIFKIIGLRPEEAKARFGFLLEAFKYGAPPHGGIAFGLDRLLTLLVGCDSIRDVIAFPKTQRAFCPMTSAPSPVDEKQLNELNIKIRK
jgi:aspartyl-tRNA synthetase